MIYIVFTFNEPLNNYKYVYFIREGLSGAIKIGSAYNVDARKKELQTGNSEELVLLHSTTGGETLERHLHKEFSQYCKRQEWFWPDESLIKLIDTMKREDETYGQILSIIPYVKKEGYHLKDSEVDLLILISRGAFTSSFSEEKKVRFWRMRDAYKKYLNQFPREMVTRRLFNVILNDGFTDEDIEIRKKHGLALRPYYI